MNEDLYNDEFRELCWNDASPDGDLTQRVIGRWQRQKTGAQRRRRVLATLGPLSAAAVLILCGLLIHHVVDQRRQRRQLAQAVSLMIRDTRFEDLVQPKLLDDALAQTSVLLNPEQTIALLVPEPRPAGNHATSASGAAERRQ